MQSVGAKLKEARERKGFSLDEINARTRITPKNLVAIERDEVRNISSPFFYRSFVRQYAEQVDLDFRVIASAVDLLAGNMPQPDLPGQGVHQPVRVAPVQARPKRDLSWVISTSVFLGFFVLGSGGYAGWKYYRPLIHQATLLPATTVAGGVPKTQAPVTAGRAAVEPAETVKPSEAKSAESIHLEVEATERTWLSVSADGKPAYTGILEPAETKVLDGQQSAKLRTGNAGGVNITFNGKEIGPIGPRGKTRTVVFTKTGYEVQSTPSPQLVPANHIGG
jgi:cytoskeletal protein RodZ